MKKDQELVIQTREKKTGKWKNMINTGWTVLALGSENNILTLWNSHFK